ncbi:ABC transporter permease [Enterovibrio nigricans]|uniref:Putative ABC transport system permease protein n=1 Tax=Enterovibrio nigricans DSM 22720 TaxID=1121868 RepID=A0A1T4UVP9_9GAMM|nr:ABC transporter permease [Enterovibrio nigricans]SKA56708.1 putative ABC transport system permease protein [Enterovibrio nigricans DSM 22720]
MFVPVARALFGHYRRHPFQVLLVWLGLTLGVALLVGVMSINQHAKDSYEKGVNLFTNPFPYVLQHQERGKRIPESIYISLRKQGFSQCVPIDLYRTQLADGKDIQLMGVDTVAMFSFNRANLDSIKNQQPLSLGYDSLWVSTELANHFDWETGQYLTLRNGQSIGPIALMEARHIGAGTRIFGDISVIRQLSDHEGFKQVYCGNMTKGERDALRAFMHPTAILTRTESTQLGPLTHAFHLNLFAMGLLAFVVGLFIFYQAISLSMAQRQPLVGTMRELGVGRKSLAIVVSLEMLIWLFLGLVGGNIAGLNLAQKLMPTVATTLSDLYGANIDLTLHWQWEWGFYSFLLGVCGFILASGWPLYRLLTTPPAHLSKRMALVRFSGKEFKWQAGIAVLLIIVALFVYSAPQSQAQGFTLIALILISGGLLLPYFMWKTFLLVSNNVKIARLRWLMSDASASLSYRGIAAMAFMMAIATNIGMETMVGSFRNTTENWLQQRLAADIYIRPDKSIAEPLSNWLKAQPDVEKNIVQWRHEIESLQGTVEIQTIGTSSEEREALALKVTVPDYWNSLHQQQTLLVSESLALEFDVETGDTIQLPSPFADEWTVAGVYFDYGNPHGQVIMSNRSALIPWVENQGRVGVAAKLKDGIDSAVLVSRLKKEFGLLDSQISNQRDILAMAMRIFDRTFLVTDTLCTLTLIIAICGLFFSTLATELSRQRQYALLRYMGISGRELAFVGGGQLMLIGLFSALFALPLGLFIAEVLVNIVLKYSFGWTMTVSYFPFSYFVTLGGALASLLIAGCWPVWRLIKRSAILSLRDAQ